VDKPDKIVPLTIDRATLPPGNGKRPGGRSGKSQDWKYGGK
jgi:hypothetical protein